jgi:aryl-alcohol dehydrogenase-like predicted oxidoreductase
MLSQGIIEINNEVNLAFGTAQLSLPYGSVQKRNPPAHQEAIAMVREARRLGVGKFDTARAYGQSEALLGEAFADDQAAGIDIITKLSPLEFLEPNTPAHTVSVEVDASVERSCQDLRQESLQTLLLHRVSHLTAWEGKVWKRLLELRGLGKIRKLGVSVQTVDELVQALEFPDITHVQLPFNILDFRWKQANLHTRLQAFPDMTVDVRSALLQGVLSSDSETAWPSIPGLAINTIRKWLDDCVRQFDRLNVVDLCYSYVRAQPWVSSIVVGMETMEQLNSNVRLFAERPLSLHECSQIDQMRPEFAEELLSPAKWS